MHTTATLFFQGVQGEGEDGVSVKYVCIEGTGQLGNFPAYFYGCPNFPLWEKETPEEDLRRG